MTFDPFDWPISCSPAPPPCLDLPRERSLRYYFHSHFNCSEPTKHSARLQLPCLKTGFYEDKRESELGRITRFCLSRLLEQIWREWGRGCRVPHPGSERVVHLCGECGLQEKAVIIQRFHDGNKGISQIPNSISEAGISMVWKPQEAFLSPLLLLLRVSTLPFHPLCSRWAN